MKRLNQSGYNLVELAIAVLILGAMASAVLMARSYMAKTTEKTSATAYATQKAIQMFEELKTLVNGAEVQGVNVLDDYSDGSSYNKMLTTDSSVTLATDPLSGNIPRGPGWKYWRQINVIKVAQDPFSRIVNVRVFGTNTLKPTQVGELLSEVGGMLRTLITQKAPTQVYDVYALSLYNVLGWFTTVPQMYNTFNNAVTTLQALNPGLEFRTHFITQMGYGRDEYYMPNINVSQSTTVAAALPFVYLYPGLTPQDGTGNGNQMFFDNSQLVQCGNILQDGAAVLNGYGNSICDMYNTDVRYPAAVSLYNLNAATAAANGWAAPELTLRMLLEQMNSSTNFKNAMLISMHGEVLPLPNMRNYSDAAKDPANNKYTRVVTHPTLLHYKTGQGVTLRVYGYYDGLLDPSTLDTSAATTFDSRASTITVYFPSLNLSAANFTVDAITGGVGNSGVSTVYSYVTSLAANTPNYSMSWNFGHPTGTSTAITLINTPLRCKAVTVTGAGGTTTGLDTGDRLYNSEYIPCVVDNVAPNYNMCLTATGAIPKNTARWVIKINPATPLADGQYAVETRIGSDLTSGTTSGPGDQMSNLSRTFVWVGSGSNAATVWGGSGVTPWTEKFQFNGDPRDCPYIDAKLGTAVANATDTGVVTIDANSYNWYFKAANVDGYSGFTKAQQGYQGNNDMRDVPRYYYMYRNAMMTNSVIYANMNGYSFWHASEGGEIGGTYNPYGSSLSFDHLPWQPTTSGTVNTIDEIQSSNNWSPIGGSNFVARNIMRYNGASTNPLTNWYARAWRNEMYPDDWFITAAAGAGGGWRSVGNLPTGTGNFWRVPYDAITVSAGGTTNGFDSGRGYQWGIGGKGPDSFMNGATGLSGAATAYGFIHTTAGTPQLADVTQLGLNIYPITNFPLNSPISCTRPWAFNGDLIAKGVLPDEWADPYYLGLRTILTIPVTNSIQRIFYESEITVASQSGPKGTDVWHGLGSIQMSKVPAAGTTTAFCYYIPSGIAPQGNFDSRVLTQVSIGAMIRTFLDGGILYANGVMGHIIQLPLIQISSGSAANQFVNPSAVTLSWSSPVSNASKWVRWAGFNSGANFYTEEYPGYTSSASVTLSTYSESVSVVYVPMYSSDGGNNFYYVNSSPATLAPMGTYYSGLPAADYTGATSIIWNTPAASFPQGTYKTRVEAFRVGQPLHYSYHELDVNFTR